MIWRHLEGSNHLAACSSAKEANTQIQAALDFQVLAFHITQQEKVLFIVHGTKF
jgi:hypothetical protein